jgi:hypothetical protein
MLLFYLRKFLRDYIKLTLRFNLISVFGTDTVEYLGHIVTRDGVRPDLRKVQAIEQYPTSQTVRDVRAFIGLAGYYRRHVRNFTEIAKPLTQLTKKEVPFNWTGEQQKAFEKLKQILSTEPLLIYPEFSQPFIVACDASTKAVGAVLSQMRNGEERPIAYCSRQLNSAESKYSVTELELLAADRERHPQQQKTRSLSRQ